MFPVKVSAWSLPCIFSILISVSISEEATVWAELVLKLTSTPEEIYAL